MGRIIAGEGYYLSMVIVSEQYHVSDILPVAERPELLEQYVCLAELPQEIGTFLADDKHFVVRQPVPDDDFTVP